MEYPAICVAKAILKQSDPELGDIISNLKLQKLLYYCQGYSLALNNKVLFQEKILKWQFGPVVKEVYFNYNIHGRNAIPIDFEFDSGSIDPKDLSVIEEVYEVYGQYSAVKLMHMTHIENPWLNSEMEQEIGVDKLKTYFKSLITVE